LTVLFLDKDNAARSILAEALLRRLGGGAFDVYSAGRAPAAKIDAHALETLGQAGCDVEPLHTKSWTEFAAASAPGLDIVVTLAEALKDGPFPAWFSNPVHAHWPFPDPVQEDGDAARRAAFRRLYGAMEQQILKMTALDLDGLAADDLRQRLRSIAPE